MDCHFYADKHHDGSNCYKERCRVTVQNSKKSDTSVSNSHHFR